MDEEEVLMKEPAFEESKHKINICRKSITPRKNDINIQLIKYGDEILIECRHEL